MNSQFLTIKCNEFQLVKFTADFITPKYLSWLNNKELMKFSRHANFDHTVESSLEFLQQLEKSSNSFFWAIITEEFGHVGNIVAYVDRSNLMADLTILIGDSRTKGLGIALSSWNAAINFLFNKAGLRKISAGTMSHNLPMLKIMLNSNMKPVGIIKRHFFHLNSEIDVLIYAICSDKFIQF